LSRLTGFVLDNFKGQFT